MLDLTLVNYDRAGDVSHRGEEHNFTEQLLSWNQEELSQELHDKDTT